MFLRKCILNLNSKVPKGILQEKKINSERKLLDLDPIKLNSMMNQYRQMRREKPFFKIDSLLNVKATKVVMHDINSNTILPILVSTKNINLGHKKENRCCTSIKDVINTTRNTYHSFANTRPDENEQASKPPSIPNIKSNNIIINFSDKIYKQNNDNEKTIRKFSILPSIKDEDEKLPISNDNNIKVMKSYMQFLIPINLPEQQAIFFENHCKINPIFNYSNAKAAAKVLLIYTKPKRELFELSIKIFNAFISEYKNESNFLQKYGGEILTKDLTEQIVNQYISDLGLSNKIVIQFSDKIVTPTSITHDPKINRSILTIALPIEYRKNRIIGVLNHEIGTHFLRHYNECSQVWHCNRASYKLKNCIATEEGLASINQLYDSVLLFSQLEMSLAFSLRLH